MSTCVASKPQDESCLAESTSSETASPASRIYLIFDYPAQAADAPDIDSGYSYLCFCRLGPGAGVP
jgi:hypothetical protein